MKTTPTRIDGDGCWQTASYKSRFNHRMYVVWRDIDGWHADIARPDTIKAALLAHGTQDHSWSLVENGVSTRGFWWMGLNVIRQMKRGWR